MLPVTIRALRDAAGNEIVPVRDAADYERLISSGLYEELVANGLLLPHQETHSGPHIAIRRGPLDFQSSPEQWCFSQLQEAGLLVLEIQSRALARGLSLKSAAAGNVQFRDGQPVFTDALAFERPAVGRWLAYPQFCRHYLAPLQLMSEMAEAFDWRALAGRDGIPLDVASELLGWRGYLRSGIRHHIHQRSKRRRIANARLVASLRNAIEATRLRIPEAKWNAYESQFTPYAASQPRAFKNAFIESTVRSIAPALVYDLGGVSGLDGRLIAGCGVNCVQFDADPLLVDLAWRREKLIGSGRLLPLIADIRSNLIDLPRAELVVALGLVQRLRVSENMPFEKQAALLAQLGRAVIVEFAAPEDPVFVRMNRRRSTLPSDYNLPVFLEAFLRHFRMTRSTEIPGTYRRLALFEQAA